jgi:hypothetical protein
VTNLVHGRFVRGPRLSVDLLMRDDLQDEASFKEQGLVLRDWTFEAVNLDVAAERALRNQRATMGRGSMTTRSATFA